MSLRGRELAAFLLLTLIWGTTWAAIRIDLGGLPPFTGVAVRFAVAGTDHSNQPNMSSPRSAMTCASEREPSWCGTFRRA